MFRDSLKFQARAKNLPLEGNQNKRRSKKISCTEKHVKKIGPATSGSRNIGLKDRLKKGISQNLKKTILLKPVKKRGFGGLRGKFGSMNQGKTPQKRPRMRVEREYNLNNRGNLKPDTVVEPNLKMKDKNEKLEYLEKCSEKFIRKGERVLRTSERARKISGLSEKSRNEISKKSGKKVKNERKSDSGKIERQRISEIKRFICEFFNLDFTIEDELIIYSIKRNMKNLKDDFDLSIQNNQKYKKDKKKILEEKKVEKQRVISVIQNMRGNLKRGQKMISDELSFSQKRMEFFLKFLEKTKKKILKYRTEGGGKSDREIEGLSFKGGQLPDLKGNNQMETFKMYNKKLAEEWTEVLWLLEETFEVILGDFRKYRQNYISKIPDAHFLKLKEFLGFALGFRGEKREFKKIRPEEIFEKPENIGIFRKFFKMENIYKKSKSVPGKQYNGENKNNLKKWRQKSIDFKVKRSYFKYERTEIKDLKNKIVELEQKIKTIESNAKKKEMKLIEQMMFEKTFSNSLKDISKNLEKKVKRLNDYLQKYASSTEWSNIQEIESDMENGSSKPKCEDFKDPIFSSEFEEKSKFSKKHLADIRGQNSGGEGSTTSDNNPDKIQSINFTDYQDDIKNYQNKIGDNQSMMHKLLSECNQMKTQMKQMFSHMNSQNTVAPQRNADSEKDLKINQKEKRIRELERLNLELSQIINNKNTGLKSLIQENLQVSKDLKENMFQEYLIAQSEFEMEKKMKEEIIGKYKTQLSEKNLKMMDMANKIDSSNSFVNDLKSNIGQMKDMGIVQMGQVDELMEENMDFMDDTDNINANMMETINSLNATIRQNEGKIEEMRSAMTKMSFERLEDKRMIKENLKMKKKLTNNGIQLYNRKMSLLQQKEELKQKLRQIEIEEEEILKNKKFESIEEYIKNINQTSIIQPNCHEKMHNSRLVSNTDGSVRIDVTQVMSPNRGTNRRIGTSMKIPEHVLTTDFDRKNLICNSLNKTKNRKESKNMSGIEGLKNLDFLVMGDDQMRRNGPKINSTGQINLGQRQGYSVSKLTEETRVKEGQRGTSQIEFQRAEALLEKKDYITEVKRQLVLEIEKLNGQILEVKNRIKDIDQQRVEKLDISDSFNASGNISQNEELEEKMEFGGEMDQMFKIINEQNLKNKEMIEKNKDLELLLDQEKKKAAVADLQSKNEIKTCNSQIESLDKQNDFLENKIENLNMKTENLNIENEHLNIENENLEIQFDDQKSENQKLKFANTKLNFAFKEKKMQIENLEREIKKLRFREKKLETKIKSNTEEIEQLNNDLLVRNNILEELSNKTLKNKSREEEKHSEIQRLREKIREKEGTIDTLKKDLVNEIKIKEQLKKQKNLVMERKMALRKEVIALRRDFSLYKINLKGLGGESEVAQEHEDTYKRNICHLFTKLTNLEQLLEVKDRKLNFQIEELEMQQKLILHLQNRVKSLKDDKRAETGPMVTTRRNQASSCQENFTFMIIQDLSDKLEILKINMCSKIVYYEKKMNLLMETLQTVSARSKTVDKKHEKSIFSKLHNNLEKTDLKSSNIRELEKIVLFVTNKKIDPCGQDVFIKFLAYYTTSQLDEKQAKNDKIWRLLEQDSRQLQKIQTMRKKNQKLKMRIKKFEDNNKNLRVDNFNLNESYRALVSIKDECFRAISKETISGENMPFSISRINDDISIISKTDVGLGKSRFFYSKDKMEYGPLGGNRVSGRNKYTTRFNFAQGLKKGFGLN